MCLVPAGVLWHGARAPCVRIYDRKWQDDICPGQSANGLTGRHFAPSVDGLARGLGFGGGIGCTHRMRGMRAANAAGLRGLGGTLGGDDFHARAREGVACAVGEVRIAHDNVDGVERAEQVEVVLAVFLGVGQQHALLRVLDRPRFTFVPMRPALYTPSASNAEHEKNRSPTRRRSTFSRVSGPSKVLPSGWRLPPSVIRSIGAAALAISSMTAILSVTTVSAAKRPMRWRAEQTRRTAVEEHGVALMHQARGRLAISRFFSAWSRSRARNPRSRGSMPSSAPMSLAPPRTRLEHAGLLELLQVAADGHVAHIHLLAQTADGDDALLAQQVQDRLASFRRDHSALSTG